MGWGKIIGFATLGVAAVAAAPFTGGGSIVGAATLAGAGTVAAAAGAATVGAAAGAYMSSEEEEKEERRQRRQRASEQAVAKAETKLKEQKSRITKLSIEVKSYDSYFDVVKLLTMYSIHICNQLGASPHREKGNIMEVIGGISSAAYPPQLKAEINSYFDRSISKQDIRNALSSLPGNKDKLLSYLQECICIDVLEYDMVPQQILQEA